MYKAYLGCVKNRCAVYCAKYSMDKLFDSNVKGDPHATKYVRSKRNAVFSSESLVLKDKSERSIW